ncbi:MAG: AI-2E family transporter [Oscillospiraceae bacterium]|jgi:predicted PurR-regulated permease PerM|nr:AI-2E family transporter [Oscillospiraceae bacterium]
MKKKRFKWDLQYLYWGITAVAVILTSIVFYLAFSHWRSGLAFLQQVMRILSPVVYGLMIAYLVNRPLKFFEKTLFGRIGEEDGRRKRRHRRRLTPARAKKLRRALSILLTIALLLIFLGGTLALILPRMYTSIEDLVTRMPNYFRVVVAWFERVLEDNPEFESAAVQLVGNVTEKFTAWVQTGLLASMGTIVTNLTSGVLSFLREVLNFFIGIVIAVYVLYHRETFAAQSKKALYAILRPKRAESTLGIVRFMNLTCGSFIMSRLLDALIVGVVCYVCMLILRMPYAMLIAVMVGVTNIIPFFGPFIGGVPAGLLVLLESPSKCVIFIIFIVVLQQLDGNVLYPKIQGSRIELSGFWILFALLLFGGWFGFWGFILGVPVFAVIYHVCRTLLGRRLEARGLPRETEAYLSGKLILPEDADAEPNFTEPREAETDDD